MDSSPIRASVAGEAPSLNISHDQYWRHQADQLPDRVVVDGREWQTARLSQEARTLLAIYLADTTIVAQHKEILALAELGLTQLKQQFCQLADTPNHAS